LPKDGLRPLRYHLGLIPAFATVYASDHAVASANACARDLDRAHASFTAVDHDRARAFADANANAYDPVSDHGGATAPATANACADATAAAVPT